MPVIDASVVVALHHAGDRHHRVAFAWLKALDSNERLAAPNLMVVEVAAAIRRLSGDADLAEEAADDVRSGGWIDLYPLTPEREEAATRMACDVAVRGADAVYLALAAELGQLLVTLDRQQLERGGEVGSVVRP
jgi:predicted nucleic acid-binding protein